MEKAPIPIFESLADIYPSSEAVLRESTRWNEIVESFTSQYGHPPSYVVRAPGRVNILGEHIDYSLFPVIPAAIEQDILLALHPTTEPVVKLNNMQSHFKGSSFPLTPPKDDYPEWHVDFISPAEGGGWENYVKVAIKECLEEFYPKGKRADGEKGAREARGMELIISGTVPPGSGLSSSAAFVVGSVITFLVANDLTEGVSKGDVVGMAMASEHRMGLRTGGMDQAASALCLSNTLLHLSFFPSLSPAPLPLPKSLAVVITNSLTPHDLTDTAPVQYNLRVVESLAAVRLLLHSLGLSDHPRVKGQVGEKGRIWLREMLEIWRPGTPEVELYTAALEHLKPVLGKNGRDEKGWTKEEMIADSGMSEEAFTETYLHHFLEVRADYFQLYKRALHCLEESLRVSRFAQICHELDEESGEVTESDPRVAELGKLLVESHLSCQHTYECTHKNTDALKDVCLKAGAIGARQTGGGWGGAVISLVPTSQAGSFVEKVQKTYPAYSGLSSAKLEEAAFATLPGSGAGVYVVHDGAIKS